MSDELKPCPFCGGEVERYNAMPGYAGGYGFYCRNCDSQFDIGDSDEDARQKWNTRAERTCRMVPMWEESDTNGYVTCECDACGWMADYAADSEPFGWCASCGAKVVCDG